ncbi:MAG: DUF3367 domain-containing protein [Desulfobacterales bacterium]|nr:DUF3367 domain-containing protein [Desulfobacterales bacterium]
MAKIKFLNLVKSHKFQELAFLISLALWRLVWFSGSQGVLAVGDFVVSANPYQFWSRLFSGWWGNELGMPNTLLPRIFYPQWTIMGPLNGVGLSPLTAEIIFVVLLSFVAAFSMFYLTRQLFPKERRVAFFATFAYMLSTQLMVGGLQSAVMHLPFFAFTPLTVLIALKAIKNKSFKYALALAFVTYFLIGVFSNPMWLLFAVIAIVAFGYFQAAKFHRVKFYTSFLAVSAGIIIVTNLFWLLPLQGSFSQIYQAGIDLPPRLYNTHSSFLEVSRLLGKGSFYTAWLGLPYVPCASVYLNNPFFIIVSFVPTLLAFGALGLRRRDTTVTFVGIFTLVILILATGDHHWFGNYYEFLVTKVPVFKSVHEAAHWCRLAALPFSLLVGVCLGEVSRRLPSIPLRSIVTGTLISAILLASLPLANGSIAKTWLTPDTKGVSIPAYYTEANDWLRQQKSPFSVFVLPSRSLYLLYGWGFQGAAAFLPQSITVPTITGLPAEYMESPSSVSVHSLYDTFYADIDPYFGKLLAKYGAKYILVETTIVFDFMTPSTPSPDETLGLLRKQEGISEIKRFGDLIIFENDYFQGWIKANHSAYVVTDSIENPSGIVWGLEEFRQESDLNIEEPIKKITLNTTMSATSEGEYLYKETRIPVTPPIAADYLLVRFKTNEHSTIALYVNTDQGSEYLVAVNPTPVREKNHYCSTDWTTLAFKLPQTPIKQVNILLTNQLNREYQGQLQATIDYVQMADSTDLALPNFTSDCPVTIDQGMATMSATSEGEYLYKETRIPVTPPIAADYLLVRFKTNEHSTIALYVNTDQGSEYLVAVNPTPVREKNHYCSTDWTTLAFKLPQAPIKQVNILLTNQLNHDYQGQLEAATDYVRLANQVRSAEAIAGATPEEWFGNTSIVIQSDIDSAMAEALQQMSLSAQPFGSLPITQEGAWAYSIQVASSEPFILSLTQSFDQGWQLQAPGASPIHFKTEGYANAWLFTQGYQGKIHLHYTHNNLFERLGIGTASFWGIIALYFLTQPLIGWLRRRRHKT